LLRGAALALLLATLVGCVTLQENYPAAPSYSFDRPEETTLGRGAAPLQARHPGLSGYRLIQGGVAALMTRAAMADLAERSIDAQYYVYEPDAAGAFLLERLIAAAERGVRVRLLLDDYMLGFEDVALAKLVDAHPQIEIRVFNPFPNRARWTRPLQLLLQLDRLGMRMHNKVFVADGQKAVIGGRNIGDHYFEAQEASNFRDVDVLASGPIVKEIGRQFDDYWNSPLAVPVAAFGVTFSERWGRRERDELKRLASEPQGPHAQYERRRQEFTDRLLKGAADLVWADAVAVAEQPVRAVPDTSKSARELSQITRTLSDMRRTAQKEVVMVMAYYVPGRRAVENISEMVARGVRVRILTNSLASTDVVAVHAGYANYRAALLAAGVELHEFRVDAERPAPQDHVMRRGSTESALHAKVIVYDRRFLWIGSANADPRSRRLNTEGGLLIESEELAQRLLKGVERDFSPRQSWRLVLETGTDGDPGRIVWTGEADGQPVRLTEEPGAGFARGLEYWFYSILPGLESHL
jgi:putative cardiolipin synthase